MNYSGSMGANGKMNLFDNITTAVIFLMVILLCWDAEFWQGLVAASLVTLVWQKCLEMGGGQ